MDNQQEIFDRLRSPVEEERVQAVRMLDLSITDGREHLLNMLGDESWRVRKEAVSQVINQSWRQEIVPELIRFLYSDDNAGLRNSSHEILVHIGERAIPDLIAEMSSDDQDVRKFVVDILGDIGSTGAIDSLIATLKDSDQNVRSAAAENLGKIKAESAVPFLIESLGDNELLFRFSILDALGKIGVEVEDSALFSLADDPLLKKPLITCLGEIGGRKSVDILLPNLFDPIYNVRLEVVKALCQMTTRYPDLLQSVDQSTKEKIVSQLSDILQNADDGLISSIITLLGALETSAAASLLFPYLLVEEYQQSAFTALIRLGDKGIDHLLSTNVFSTEKERAYLCYLIGETGYKGGLAFLVQSFSSSDPEVQHVVAQAFGKVGDEGSINTLIDALGSDDSFIREASVSALASLSIKFPDSVLKALHPLFESENQEVRVGVVEILGHIGGRELEPYYALALKDPSSLVRRAVIRIMDGEFAVGHLESLKISLTDEDVDVRKEVVDLLGRIANDEALGLLQIVITNDDDLWVRATALRALSNYPAHEVRVLLLDVLKTNDGLLALATLESFERIQSLDEELFSIVFQHSDSEVVREGLDLLVRNGLRTELAEITPVLIERADSDIKLALIRAVAALPADPLVKKVVAIFLNDPDLNVRNEISQYFGTQTGV